VAEGRFQTLLGLAVLLAVLRLVVVPWTQSQGETRQQLEVLTQRLDRSAGVVGSKEHILAARAALEKSTSVTRKAFPLVQDRERFRLEAQRQISAVAAGGNAKVTLFDWIIDGTAPDAGLAYGRANVKLDGALEKLVALHGELEGRMPNLAIREAKVDLGRGATGIGPTPASLLLVVDLYYQEQPATGAATEGPGTMADKAVAKEAS
jgi:hypothetical protein